MELKEWIVTLHKREDLEDFYEDMETPGGNLFIPDRAVDVANKRPISRNTHYMLTHDEAELIRQDERVWGVDLVELIDATTRPLYTITNGDFDKSWFDSATDVNWGLLRHSEATNRTNWGAGSGGTYQITDDLTITASGKNVDVVIVDGHIDPAHPEFAANPDGSGGTRVQQFNWFSLNSQVTGGANGTYVYAPYVDAGNPQRTDDNNHGCHCAGTVAGNSQGWARDANIYNISPYSTNPNSLNPVTGRRNPTITNNSYGSAVTPGQNNFGTVTEITYRGTTYSPGRELTVAELNERGFFSMAVNAYYIPNYFTSRLADIQDAIADGIILVFAGGNEYWKIVNSSDQDYDNTYKMTYFGTNYDWFSHRGTGSGAFYEPVITVGALGQALTEDKAVFSNCGSQIDIFAAGEAINSSVHERLNDVADPRLAGYNFDKYQAHQWIIDTSGKGLMLDTEADDPMDLQSLQGAPNRILRWINQRPESGSSYPQRNFKPRPSSGITYPRPKIRRRG
jgi:hypothetical protein